MLLTGSNSASALRVLAAGLVMSMGLAVGSAQATVVAVEDWHLTTDTLGGIKQSNIADNIYFAVSRDTSWNPANEYEMPDGYRWISSVEYVEIINSLPLVGGYSYYGQGGWSGYLWEGAYRYHFRFSDSSTNGAYTHAGNYDYHMNYGYYYNTHYHAGFVLIKDTTIPEPGTIVLLGLGLAGLGLSRRTRRKS